MDVHKTLCCFYTTKRMTHESTRYGAPFVKKLYLTDLAKSAHI